MIYLIVNKKDREIIKIKSYQKYQDTLEALGSFPDCDFFHMILGEEDYLSILYALRDSGEASYSGFRLIDKN